MKSENGNIHHLPPQEELQLRNAPLIVSFSDDIPKGLLTPELLGNKGLNLIQTLRAGLLVPEGFIVTTRGWEKYKEGGDILPTSVCSEIESAVEALEIDTHRGLNREEYPLIVSVRSGAPISMPGVMDTILNIGINDKTVAALAKEIGEKEAYEAYLNLVIQFGVRNGQDETLFEAIKDAMKNASTVSGFQELMIKAKGVLEANEYTFPEAPIDQIVEATEAVMASWDSSTTGAYREQHDISGDLGTAVVIQRMVFGNSKKHGAGTGVLFSHNTKTLEGEAVVVYRPHAQGPEVVGDTNLKETPVSDLLGGDNITLPLYRKIQGIITRVRDMYPHTPQEIEFTTDGKDAYVLQVREAPLSNVARFRSTLQRVTDGIPTTILQRELSTQQLYTLLQPDLDPNAVQKALKEKRFLAGGQRISLGHAIGVAVNTVEDAQKFKNEAVVLVGKITLDDLHHLPNNVVAIVAENGSLGSHIARIAEKKAAERHIPIVFGAEVSSDLGRRTQITVDGNHGRIFKGAIKTYKNGGSHILTEDELKTISLWYGERIRNPWRFAAESDEGIEAFQEVVQEVVDANIYQSPKAIEVALFNKLIASEIRMQYDLFDPNDTDGIVPRIQQILAMGNDVTIRTCHTPHLPQGGPWAPITSPDQIDKLFSDPEYSKYGNYASMVSEKNKHRVTEVIVGSIPKDKLNPIFEKEHCTWTLACTSDGEIVLQIRPFSPQMRDHENINPEEIMTLTFHPRQGTETPKITETVGSLIQKSPYQDLAQKLKRLVVEEVLHTWWNQYRLPQRLAAISGAYQVPVLEGQARINQKDPDGSWCLIYGIKTE